MTTLTPPIHPLRSTEMGPIGLLQTLRGNALTMWGRRAYERPAMVGSFLGRTQVLLNDPDAIQHVLVRNAANYRRPGVSRRVLAPLIGDGLLLSEGAAWRHQRRTIAPIMAPRSMPILTGHVAVAAAETRDRLASQPGPVELLPEMQRAALDVAGRSMFSLEMADRGGAMRPLLTKFALTLARPSALDLLLPKGSPTPRDGARRRFRAEWMALIGGIVDARAAVDAPRDLFDLLVSARDPETGAAFTREQLCDQVATMILAGHETTALTLFWSLALLAQSQEWQDAVAAEAAKTDLSPQAAADAVARLPVTRAIVSEALRLYPPAFLITREAIARDTANRTMIPRGATVAIAPWVLHRHSALWQNPHSFDPGPLHARRSRPRPLRLPTVRRRAADLRRRPIRHGGGRPDAGYPDRSLPRGLGRHCPCSPRRPRDDPARPPGALHLRPAVSEEATKGAGVAAWMLTRILATELAESSVIPPKRLRKLVATLLESLGGIEQALELSPEASMAVRQRLEELRRSSSLNPREPR